MTKSEKILEAYKEDPNLKCRDIANKIGCTTRYVRRVINPIRNKDITAIQKPIGMTPAKILLLDIETAPMEVFSWRLWKQTVLPHQIIKDWSILSWAAKW